MDEHFITLESPATGALLRLVTSSEPAPRIISLSYCAGPGDRMPPEMIAAALAEIGLPDLVLPGHPLPIEELELPEDPQPDYTDISDDDDEDDDEGEQAAVVSAVAPAAPAEPWRSRPAGEIPPPAPTPVFAEPPAPAQPEEAASNGGGGKRGYHRRPEDGEIARVFPELGFSPKRIAERYGVPQHTAQHWLTSARKAGLFTNA